MRRTIIRALVFAVTLTAISVTFDLFFTVVYQGGPPHGVTRQFIVFRSALHGATLILTAVGALAGFAFLRSYSISNARVATLAAFLGVITLAALLIAFQVAGFWAMALWLVLSSAVTSYVGGRLLGTLLRLPQHPNSRVPDRSARMAAPQRLSQRDDPCRANVGRAR